MTERKDSSGTPRFTKDEAIEFARREGWKEMSHRERAAFQLHHRRLCMPVSVFHESIEEALGRPVYTHEFGLNWDGLIGELEGTSEAPTLAEIVAMIPEGKMTAVIGASNA